MQSLPFAVLLAEERLEYLPRGFRQRPTRIDFGDVMMGACVVIAFVVALWLLSRLMDYRQQRGPSKSRLGLFFSLCKAQGLEWREWWLLWRVARRHGLRDPARVFLEPERLEPAGLGRGFQRGKPRLDALRKRLFAGLPHEDLKPQGTAEAAPQH